MKKNNRGNTLLWAVPFVFLTILSLDYWWWDASARFGPFGLPIWVFYFVALQFALAAAVYLFARHYWDHVDDGDDDEKDDHST